MGRDSAGSDPEGVSKMLSLEDRNVGAAGALGQISLIEGGEKLHPPGQSSGGARGGSKDRTRPPAAGCLLRGRGKLAFFLSKPTSSGRGGLSASA